MTLPKFSNPLDESSPDSPIEFCYPDVYSRESYPGWERLRVGCRSGEVDWILSLLADHPGPFRVLLILLVPRDGQEAGRYASQEDLDRFQLTTLLRNHEEAIEQDGRHHLWVTTADNERTIVFDQHNYLFLYGPLDDWITQFQAKGFTPGECEMPVPHAHHFHTQFDDDFHRMLRDWDWHLSPLRDEDEA